MTPCGQMDIVGDDGSKTTEIVKNVVAVGSSGIHCMYAE